MGCGGSKDKADKEIDYAMEWIDSSEFNDFFSSCETVLQTAEELRSGWEDSLETMYEIAATNYLKAPATLVDATTVWVWALSANNGGEINKCKPSATAEAPYLDVKIPGSLPKKEFDVLDEFRGCLQKYIEACINGVKKLPETVQEIVGLVEKGNTLKDSADKSLSHLDMMGKAKNIGKIGKNIAKLTKGLNKLKALQPMVPEAVKNMQLIVKQMPDIVKAADDNGKKALGLKLTFPCDIMQHLFPAEKFSEKEIKELKVAAEKQKIADEEAKKKKQSALEKFIAEKKALLQKK